MVEIKGKEADRFLRKMRRTEKRKPNKKEIQMAKDIKYMVKKMSPEQKELRCKICNKIFNSLEDASVHSQNTKHYEFYNPLTKLRLCIG